MSSRELAGPDATFAPPRFLRCPVSPHGHGALGTDSSVLLHVPRTPWGALAIVSAPMPLTTPSSSQGIA